MMLADILSRDVFGIQFATTPDYVAPSFRFHD